ncbi:alpha/beta fold hydrolase [Actinomadura bangladeshensis]|uniref:Alpha/beta hydrolase n=1 Tax=Actinomadura bangladeshensis TaxID=453573 RepID=A0A6L9QWY0_9ACTN|nr:alpha/beta fold hydrolase [Actinomadura bangladeshensis]NEA29871.1 alpha/beta hydrolase [Actinomadura bangladeshensis]
MDEQRIARFTHAGVADAEVSVHPFATGDGLGLNLTRFRRAAADAGGDAVLLVHGLTTSSDMYIMPEHTNLVNFLHDAGFGDVWAVDLRISGRFPYNSEMGRHSLDALALWDHPAAIAELRRHIGDKRLHVVTHCVGSISFSMALFAGTVTGVTSLVCNSVSLTPRTPAWSKIKLGYGPALMEYVVGPCHLDPRFGTAPVMTRGWMLAKAVAPFHRECAEPACHMLSFMWGGGKPIYTHEKMSPVTHGRLPDLFGACNVDYYRHIHKMVKAGRAVKYDRRDPRFAALPDDYLADAAAVPTPILFLTGDRNHVFTDSNIVCHRTLEEAAPGRHELAVLPGYGHQDPFMGRFADTEVFPQVVDFLKRKAG